MFRLIHQRHRSAQFLRAARVDSSELRMLDVGFLIYILRGTPCQPMSDISENKQRTGSEFFSNLGQGIFPIAEHCQPHPSARCWPTPGNRQDRSLICDCYQESRNQTIIMKGDILAAWSICSWMLCPHWYPSVSAIRHGSETSTGVPCPNYSRMLSSQNIESPFMICTNPKSLEACARAWISELYPKAIRRGINARNY